MAPEVPNQGPHQARNVHQAAKSLPLQAQIQSPRDPSSHGECRVQGCQTSLKPRPTLPSSRYSHSEFLLLCFWSNHPKYSRKVEHHSKQTEMATHLKFPKMSPGNRQVSGIPVDSGAKARVTALAQLSLSTFCEVSPWLVARR